MVAFVGVRCGYEVGGASILRGDNTSSIMAAKNPGQHRSQLRHLELHAWAVRDLVREGHVRLLWVPTDENASDLLTKAITSPSKFAKFQAVILGDEQPAARAELLATGQGKDVGDGKKVKCFMCRRACI